MADRFYSLEFGGDKVSVAEAGSTTASADVELRITYDASNNGKQSALMAIEQIKAHIVESSWPPV